MDLISIAMAVGAGGLVYLMTEIMQRRNKALRILIPAIKKKQLIALLETDKTIYFRTIAKIHKNIGITSNKELVILTKDSPKICPELGVAIVHGDLYKSITVPMEARDFFQEKVASGWRPEDIGKFLQEIEQTPAEALKTYYKQIKDTGVYPESIKVMKGKDEKGGDTQEVVGQPANDVDKEKYDVFIGMSSVVKDFIYTGINRVSLHDMLRELVIQRELEKFGTQRNWIVIAIAVFIILIAIAFAVRFISGSPGLPNLLGGLLGPERVAP
jgi:hypothetical protein